MKHIPEQQITSIINLFVKWNNHDNQTLGERMVHRFDKWFDCLATVQLGDNKIKNQAHLNVCKAFSDALRHIEQPKELVPTAYQLFQSEMTNHTDVAKYFDGEPTPATMVQEVWSTLSQVHQNLLLQVYARNEKPKQSEMLPLLEARYALKGALFNKFLLSNQDGVDWVLESEIPDRDLIPMPLFESGQLKDSLEQQYFECWLINAPIICLDIQEFAPFTHALKEGCIVSELKISTDAPLQSEAKALSEPVKENTPAPANDAVSTPIPMPQPEEDNVNAIMKPVLLLILTAAILGGIWVLLGI